MSLEVPTELSSQPMKLASLTVAKPLVGQPMKSVSLNFNLEAGVAEAKLNIHLIDTGEIESVDWVDYRNLAGCFIELASAYEAQRSANEDLRVRLLQGHYKGDT